MAAIFGFLKQIALAMQLQAAVPQLDPAAAAAHVHAAYTAATPHVTPELLLAIAFVESRYDATATSRVERGVRRTGPYPSTTPPPHLDRKASLYCGPLQTFASSWQECIAERELAVAYAAGAAELEKWLADRRVRGNIMRALAGHGCGNAGVQTGACHRYPERVRWVEERLLPARDRRVRAAS